MDARMFGIPRRGSHATVALETFVLGTLLTMACAAAPVTTGNFEACETASPARVTSTEPDVSEARVRFTVGDAEIIVNIADNPTSRDFVSMLPPTLEFEDFASMEKLSYLPRDLTTEGSIGGPPANGDLIYFVPWGNLGFFYDAERRDASYDDRVSRSAPLSPERLDDLETGPVCAQRVP